MFHVEHLGRRLRSCSHLDRKTSGPRFLERRRGSGSWEAAAAPLASSAYLAFNLPGLGPEVLSAPYREAGEPNSLCVQCLGMAGP
jgi:hypothetical protein